jgi:hypothetical protein
MLKITMGDYIGKGAGCQIGKTAQCMTPEEGCSFSMTGTENSRTCKIFVKP